MVIEFQWNEMDIGDKKVLTTTPRHNMGDWLVFNKPRAGVGKVEVIQGSLPVPPEPIRKVLMVSNVSGVMTFDGRFAIIVKDQTRWLGVKPDIESILAVELEGFLDAMDQPTDT